MEDTQATKARRKQVLLLQPPVYDLSLEPYTQFQSRVLEILRSLNNAGEQRPVPDAPLQRLVEEGLLVRSPGKGTFIARAVPCIIHSIDRVSAFMDTFRRNGEDVRTQMIDFGWLGREVPLPEKLRDWPRPVLRFDRLYVSRGIPHAVARVCLPYTIGNHISSADVESTPVYRMLREKFAQEPMGSEFLVSCEQPPKNISDLLEVSPSTSLLVLERITRDASGNPLEYTTHFLRPDIYRLSVHLGEEGAGV